MKRWNRLGLAVIAAAVVVLLGVVVHGSPKPAAYASPGDPLAGRTIYTAPAPPAVLIVGDSYAAGGGADAPNRGFPYTVAEKMRWLPNLDAEPGTGFVNDNHAGKTPKLTDTPYIGRLGSDRQKFVVDILIVTGGRNDFAWPSAQAASATAEYLRQARATFPHARMVIVAPFWMDSHPIPQILAERDAEQALSAQLHAVFIDPLAEGWMNDQLTPRYLSSDGTHPNQAGHDYLALRLTMDLRADHV